MADTDQNAKSIVVVIDKNNLVRLMNVYGAQLLRVGVDFDKLEPSPKKFDELAKKVGSPEKAKEVIKSMTSAATSFTSRDGRKELLAKLGVTADTPDDYRLVAYIDPAQTVLFKGTLQGDKIIANESYVPPKEFQGLSTVTAAIGLDEEKAAELWTDVMKNSFKKLPKPIEIPAQKSEKLKSDDIKDPSNGIEIQMINFTPDQQKKLEEQVTLLALADKALHSNVALSGSNASLPFNIKNERGAQV